MYYIYRDFSIAGWASAILLLVYGLGVWQARRSTPRESADDKADQRHDP